MPRGIEGNSVAIPRDVNRFPLNPVLIPRINASGAIVGLYTLALRSVDDTNNTGLLYLIGYPEGIFEDYEFPIVIPLEDDDV